MKDGNIFGKAAAAREAEQRQIEAATKAGKAAAADGGQAVSGAGQAVPRKATTILLDPEKRVAIRKLAADLDTNVSDLINQWISEKCGKYL